MWCDVIHRGVLAGIPCDVQGNARGRQAVVQPRHDRGGAAGVSPGGASALLLSRVCFGGTKSNQNNGVVLPQRWKPYLTSLSPAQPSVDHPLPLSSTEAPRFAPAASPSSTPLSARWKPPAYSDEKVANRDISLGLARRDRSLNDGQIPNPSARL
jgi:hypothetical protein